MKNVSREFKKAMESRKNFYQEAHIVFADGREKDLGRHDFYISGNSYVDGAGTGSFPLGVAMSKRITLSLVNDDDRFSDYDFYMAKITAYCKFDLDSRTESILLGIFTVTSPESYGAQVTVQAVDGMYLGDQEYSTGLLFPLTAGEALRDSCNSCGVAMLSARFKNDDYLIEQKPEKITHRQLWGMCAMLAGGNVRMDAYNRLEIISYDVSFFERGGLDGGAFDEGSPYATGDSADGGSFRPWDKGDSFDGGDFGELGEYHMFYKTKTPKIDTDDVVITGIQAKQGESTHLSGKEGYVLSVESQIISGNPQDAVDRIGSLLIGIRFRPFAIEHTAYPLAEFGDICYVADRKGNVYQSIVTDVSFTYYGYTSIKCSADSPLRNSSKYYSQSTEAIVTARKEAETILSSYDKAMQDITNVISNSFGLFRTDEVLEDGSTVFYLHDKPTLSESKNIWKMTAGGFEVSNDGGKNFTAGITADGVAALNALSAIGISFDWAEGGTLTLGGKDNKNGVLKILDEDKNEVGHIDKTGVHFNNGTFSGDLSGSRISNGNGTFVVDENGKCEMKDAVVTGTIIGKNGYSLEYYDTLQKPNVRHEYVFVETYVDELGEPYLNIKTPDGTPVIQCGENHSRNISEVFSPYYRQITPMFSYGIYAEHATIKSLHSYYTPVILSEIRGTYVTMDVRRSGAFISVYGIYHVLEHSAGTDIVFSIEQHSYEESFLPTENQVNAVGYQGKRTFVFVLTAGGTLTIRNASELDLNASEQQEIHFRFDFFRFTS